MLKHLVATNYWVEAHFIFHLLGLLFQSPYAHLYQCSALINTLAFCLTRKPCSCRGAGWNTGTPVAGKPQHPCRRSWLKLLPRKARVPSQAATSPRASQRALQSLCPSEFIYIKMHSAKECKVVLCFICHSFYGEQILLVARVSFQPTAHTHTVTMERGCLGNHNTSNQMQKLIKISKYLFHRPISNQEVPSILAAEGFSGLRCPALSGNLLSGEALSVCLHQTSFCFFIPQVLQEPEDTNIPNTTAECLQ